MSLTIKEIKAPVATEMSLFEDKFKAAMKSDVALLDKISYYIIKRKGKQLRPLFVFLAAKMCGTITEGTYLAASLIELLVTLYLLLLLFYNCDETRPTWPSLADLTLWCLIDLA